MNDCIVTQKVRCGMSVKFAFHDKTKNLIKKNEFEKFLKNRTREDVSSLVKNRSLSAILQSSFEEEKQISLFGGKILKPSVVEELLKEREKCGKKVERLLNGGFEKDKYLQDDIDTYFAFSLDETRSGKEEGVPVLFSRELPVSIIDGTAWDDGDMEGLVDEDDCKEFLKEFVEMATGETRFDLSISFAEIESADEVFAKRFEKDAEREL